MFPDTEIIHRWAVLNGLSIAAEPFGLHVLADDPPTGADSTPTPNEENAVHLVDAEDRPAAVVWYFHRGHWMRELRDLCRWLKLPAFAPPCFVNQGDALFLVVRRTGATEPRWLSEQLD